MKTVHVVQDASANALALSPDSSQVVIAGSHVFKIFSIEENDLVERSNLRAGKNLNLNFSCSDVVWNPIDENILATGATNGAVVTWNLKKAARSKLDCVFKDHERTVNKVNFHPTEAHLLLSGSQDGVMKLFDLRRKESVSTFKSNAEFVRDVQFSPHVSHLFVSGTENGNIQLWDMRRPDKFDKQFTGQHGPVFTLDWHPEVKTWLATGSRDSTIKVWDLTDVPTVRNTIRTVASVARVRWRPGKKFHIASCALTIDSSISVWDIQRPYIPLCLFNEHKDAINGIAWRNDPNSLLSVGKDLTLYHHNFLDATCPMDSANPVGLHVSTHGDVAISVKAKEEIEPPAAMLIRQTSTKHTMKKPSLIDTFTAVTSSLKTLECKEDSILSSKSTIELALNYKLSGRSISEVCEHNANVARKVGRLQEMATWQMVQILYGGIQGEEPKRFPSGSKDDQRPIQDSVHDSSDLKPCRSTPGDGCDSYSEENDTEPDNDNDNYDIKLANIACGKTHTYDFFFGDGEVGQIPIEYENFEYLDSSQTLTVTQLPNEAFQPRQLLPSRTNTPPDRFHLNKDDTSNMLSRTNSEDTSGYMVDTSSMLHGIKPFVTESWDYDSLVVDMLHHYVAEGNVQMTVTVIIVLSQRIMKLLNEELVEYWYIAYIDILHRLRLWNIATQIIKHAHSIPTVQEMNQISTNISLQCGKCGHSLGPTKYYCTKCSSIASECALCHQPVRGLYVWCQGCSHGGHLYHIQEWLQENKECPAGCGHYCQYT